MDDTKVVIFEDNDDLRESLRLLVNGSTGYEVKAAYPNCTFVREALEQHAPDVVLMDIDMPEVNGIRGLEIIKEISPSTQVIMLTVFDHDEHVFKAMCAGADGYLLKKSPPARILSAIEEVQTGGAPMSPNIARKVLSFFSMQKKVQQKSDRLTPKETEVLKQLVRGLSYKMIASELEVSIDTIRTHIKNIYKKLQVNSMNEAVAKAILKKLV